VLKKFCHYRPPWPNAVTVETLVPKREGAPMKDGKLTDPPQPFGDDDIA
jgi:hypothetical protein